jgi:hypothetical protein
MGMTWPEIAGCLRKEMTTVQAERVGSILGVWRDKQGREVDGFHAAFERGGTRLVLQCEVGDFERLDAKVATAVKHGMENVLLIGRIVAIRSSLDVMRLSRSRLEEGAQKLVARAIKARQGSVEALAGDA